ncbi:hypothetical protein RN001_013124 [Aquatica leii]|uniref:Vesicle transport through interaction with t-SNAREs homolog 1A n=1 Tax=Aquatica leii TaxID=1421715 RepID=A0AAN7SDN5_9COLE|nr:hypothetical protein RN001_013124 [Aquatica leii]
MVSLFENYEEQYSVLTADITSRIGLLSTSGPKDRRQLISKIEKNVKEAQELLEQMDLEVREVEVSKQQRCKTKLECYRAELKRLTLEYIKARSIKQGTFNYESQEEFEDLRIGENQKQKLLDNSERIERTGKRLDEGYRVILETQEIGTHVLQNLSEQRETIQRSRDRLRSTSENLGNSSRITNMMIMRSIQEKIIFLIVGVCFVIAISFGLYLTFKK